LFFDLDYVKIIDVSSNNIEIEVQSPIRSHVFVMITYTSLFETTPKDIFEMKEH